MNTLQIIKRLALTGDFSAAIKAGGIISTDLKLSFASIGGVA